MPAACPSSIALKIASTDFSEDMRALSSHERRRCMNVDEKDLDGDGRPEYTVWDNCGSSVCDFAVLMKAGHQWRVLLNDAGSLEQLATKHLGWFDLRVKLMFQITADKEMELNNRRRTQEWSGQR